ncbi:LCP family protein [Streptomyces sp. GC420]|uniref:LCP family protein n=1 Tax=Streptomyces sp. GC420 TaxID=2697568 RepID=UPI001414D1A6|nr:LCP family protein [Streptomyces sp. GC420]NBM18212.1 LytR family transcriptional regulator [Streptomyces sp. GC420]
MRVVTAVSVLVLGAGAIGHATLSGMDTGIDRVDAFRDMKNRPDHGRGMNILLVGTDGRDKVGAEDRRAYRLGGAPCNCTDTVMLLHLSGDRERASVVSLPRDSYAELPAHTDRSTGRRHGAHPVKLNAAYAEGGPSLTVRTVESMTKVKIDHYLEIDFVSFMRAVDVLGGVEICTARPLRDSHTGLDLAPGRHLLRGGDALRYVRSRHIDGTADLSRMQRQQRFLAALMDRATGSGVLLNPVTFKEVSTTLLDAVRADRGFGARQVLDLARALRGFSPASSEFVSVPTERTAQPVRGIGSTLRWDEDGAERLFEAVREDRPLATAGRPRAPRGKTVDVAPREIRVRVENGTSIPGLGGRVDRQLRATGFDTTRTPRTAREQGARRTVIAYDPRWKRSARALLAALPGSELRAVPGTGPTLTVTVGSAFRRVTPVRAGVTGGNRLGVTTGDKEVCR